MMNTFFPKKEKNDNDGVSFDSTDPIRNFNDRSSNVPPLNSNKNIENIKVK